MKTTSTIFLTTALPCEAKPLIAHFKLKKATDLHAFEIYRNGKMHLTVTGPGKIAMSAGVAYTRASIGAINNAISINIGVAGHRAHPLGSAWTCHKISDLETGKSFYPMPVYGISCATMSILTASKPQLDYDHEHLCDMEASAFFETAAKFSTSELIQCFKIVSDNLDAPGPHLDPAHVSASIRNNIDGLAALIETLERRVKSIETTDHPDFERCVRHYRLTVSQQLRLKALLSRLSALLNGAHTPIDTENIPSGKALLEELTRRIDSVPYEL
ncbi:MAG: hypothetical protein Kow0065_14420 [Methylomicrobium sp.]